MAAEHYRLLVDQICEHTLIPNPASLYHATNLTVRGIDFSLYYLDDVGQGSVSTLCDFGALPARQRETVLQRLLETNFYLFDSPGAPTLSFNDQNQRVVLACKLPLAGMDAQALITLLGQFADMALMWRTDYFLDAAASKPSTAPERSTSLRDAGYRTAGLTTRGVLS